MTIYTVKKGDTLSSIARRHMTTASRLASDNALEAPDTLSVGQTLVIQEPTMTYVVGRNDTLFDIADKFGVSENELKRNNPILIGKDKVYPGQELIVSLDTEKLGTISVNGYAYTNIDRDILKAYRAALSYATDRIRDYCLSRGANYLLASAEDDIGEIIFGKLEEQGVVK